MLQPILLIDDDPLLRRSLSFNLEQAGYLVHAVDSAVTALESIRAESPLLILLDIGLPGMDGMEALRRLRNYAPVILVTARQRHLDEVLGLELGADDYVTKPFEFDVLLARIHTVLRRVQRAAAPALSNQVVVGDLVVDVARHIVTLAGEQIALPPREFHLLQTLARNAGRVLSINELISQVWGGDFLGEPQIVYVYIRALREKIEKNPQHPQRIMTVRGVGYKLLA
jgi:DNA-binding response OmpR family regulator